MKILVPIKRVVDYKVSVRVKADYSDVETSHVKMSMNPFDAIRIKEQGLASEIIVISIGEASSQDILRAALAMGADRALLIKTQSAPQPLAVAKLLQAIILKEAVQFVILGKQAIDTDDNQVGQMLAGLLNWPQGTFASQLQFHDAGVSVTREIDGGLETVFLTLPAVVTTDLRLNEPRYPSVMNIVQAKQKPLAIIECETLACEITVRIKTLNMEASKPERAHLHIENVHDLVDRLRHDNLITR